MRSNILNLLFFFCISTFIIFFSFATNKMSFFSSSLWFVKHQINSDDLVYKGIISTYLGKSHILSPLKVNNREVFMDAFISSKDFRYIMSRPQEDREEYIASFGLQKVFIYPYYKFLSYFNIVKEDMVLFVGTRAMVYLLALVNALTLAGLALWGAKEFGIRAASFFVGLTCIFSPWLTVFAHSSYWMLWSWFLPMVFSCLYMQKYKRITKVLLLALSFLMCIKALMGYEYISTIALACAFPIVYYGVLCGETFLKILKKAIVIGIACVSGVIGAFILHAIQISIVRPSSFIGGLQFIFETMAKRTHTILGYQDATSNIVNSLDASTFGTVVQYLFSINGNEYLYIILLGFVFYIYKRHSINIMPEAMRVKFKALFTTTCLSILAPISWHILAKAHSAEHTGMNYVLWYIPFNLLIFLLASILLSSYYPKLRIKIWMDYSKN